MPREVTMRHRMPHFLHIFGDDGYSAAYYSYLWADALAADAWEVFLEAGGPWDSSVARAFYDTILSAGNTSEPDLAYRRFRGRDVGIDALLRKRGFL
jgi:peptidyl-dipeptidase Dcp